jgi:hypothetical protein
MNLKGQSLCLKSLKRISSQGSIPSETSQRARKERIRRKVETKEVVVDKCSK